MCRLRVQEMELEAGEVYVRPHGTGQKTKRRHVYLGKTARRALWRCWAGRDNVYPQRFRHTFAIQFLRHDGDVFSLQRMLGHSTLETVKHYLAIADSDAQNTHQRASPADRRRL